MVHQTVFQCSLVSHYLRESQFRNGKKTSQINHPLQFAPFSASSFLWGQHSAAFGVINEPDAEGLCSQSEDSINQFRKLPSILFLLSFSLCSLSAKSSSVTKSRFNITEDPV